MLTPIRIHILEKVVRSILVLKGGDKAALTDLVKIIIVCLIFKQPLDLSGLILMMMRECTQQGRRVLGYGKLVTALLRKEQFDFGPYHPMGLESAIDEEKVTAMTKGERTRRARAQVQEERAQREEEEDDRSEEGLEFEEVGSDSAAGGGVVDFQRTMLGLLRGVEDQLKGIRADVQSLGTWVLAMERRLVRMERPDTAGAAAEADATVAEGETGGDAAITAGVPEAEVGQAAQEGVGTDDIEATWGDA